MLRKPESGAGAHNRRYIRKQLVMIRINLLHDTNETFSTDNVNTFALSVEVDIVRFANDRYTRHLASTFGVEDEEKGGFASDSEHAMISLVQSHGVVALSSLKGPLRHLASITVDGFNNLPCIGAVHKHPVAIGFNLEGLGMSTCFDQGFGNSLIGRGINGGDTAIVLSVTDQNPFVLRVPSQIIGIAAQIDRLLERIGGGIEDEDFSIRTCIDDLVEAGHVEHALRIGGTSERVDQLALEPVFD